MHQGRSKALIAGAAIVVVAALAAAVLQSRRKRLRPMYDYSDRSGFPRPPDQMRGAARAKKERAQGPLSGETVISP